MKLIGFKVAYNLENTEDYKNSITFEPKYNVMKRKMEVIENNEEKFD